ARDAADGSHGRCGAREAEHLAEGPPVETVFRLVVRHVFLPVNYSGEARLRRYALLTRLLLVRSRLVNQVTVTAAIRTMPETPCVQFGETPHRTIRFWIVPMTHSPRSTPKIEPRPPVSWTPPMIVAASTVSS